MNELPPIEQRCKLGRKFFECEIHRENLDGCAFCENWYRYEPIPEVNENFEDLSKNEK